MRFGINRYLGLEQNTSLEEIELSFFKNNTAVQTKGKLHLDGRETEKGQRLVWALSSLGATHMYTRVRWGEIRRARMQSHPKRVGCTSPRY